MKRTGTVALIVSSGLIDPAVPPTYALVDALSDDEEIDLIHEAISRGERDPLAHVYSERKRKREDDEVFGDYVEALLCQPFLKEEIKNHGLQWLESKIKIEKFQKSEADATRVIAEYAFQVFLQNAEVKDFILASSTAKVRVRVVVVPAGVQGTSVAA